MELNACFYYTDFRVQKILKCNVHNNYCHMYSVEGDSAVNVQVAEETWHANKNCIVRTNCLLVLLLFRGARFFDDFVKQRLISSIYEQRAQLQAVKARYVSLSCRPFSCRLVLCFYCNLHNTSTYLCTCDIARNVCTVCKVIDCSNCLFRCAR